MIPGSLGLDGLTIDTVCVDEVNCSSLAGTFGAVTAWSPKVFSTHVSNPKSLTPTVN